MEEVKTLTTQESVAMSAYSENEVHGFEETKDEDVIIPRIKVIQALSPERQDGEAVEGDILNSLTKEKFNGQKFVPVKQYYSNINWNSDRNADTRIFCRSFDGHIGQDESGSLSCQACKKNQFDNTKTGKAAQPICTSYLNFLGFFEGSMMPVVLSFSRTNYNEGKKLLSIAKSMRCNAWNYTYILEAKKISKDKNSWFIIVPRMAGQSSPEDRALAIDIYKAFEKVTSIKADYEDTGAYNEADNIDQQTASEI